MKGIIKLIFKTIFFGSIALTIAMLWFDRYFSFSDDANMFTNEEKIENVCPIDSNVALISIHGDIVTYFTESSYSEETGNLDEASSEEIVKYIGEIEKDDNIKALILEIDSYGGYPVAAEEITNALKKMTKPIIAVIREGAASAAYFIATGADKIYASEMSDVGGIGVTRSYLDYSEKNKNEGIIYQQLSLGKFKDSGDPDKVLSKEEKELFMRDIKIMYDILVKRVAENRKLDIEKVKKLADGSTMLGQAAKENGLIDEIGDIDSAEKWIGSELKIEPKICVY